MRFYRCESPKSRPEFHFPHALINLFGAANESVHYANFAVRSFRICLCMMVLATVNKAAFIYLQSLGRALSPTLSSMVREVVFGVGFALLLPRFFGLNGGDVEAAWHRKWLRDIAEPFPIWRLRYAFVPRRLSLRRLMK